MEKDVIRDYTENYLAVKDITKKYGISKEEFYHILKSNSVKRITAAERKYMTAAMLFDRRYSMEELEQAVIARYSSGLGQRKTGQHFGITAKDVKCILRKHGIHIRNKNEATRVADSLE